MCDKYDLVELSNRSFKAIDFDYACLKCEEGHNLTELNLQTICGTSLFPNGKGNIQMH